MTASEIQVCVWFLMDDDGGGNFIIKFGKHG